MLLYMAKMCVLPQNFEILSAIRLRVEGKTCLCKAIDKVWKFTVISSVTTSVLSNQTRICLMKDQVSRLNKQGCERTVMENGDYS